MKGLRAVLLRIGAALLASGVATTACTRAPADASSTARPAIVGHGVVDSAAGRIVLSAAHEGVVTANPVQLGAHVERGAALIRFEPAPARLRAEISAATVARALAESRAAAQRVAAANVRRQAVAEASAAGAIAGTVVDDAEQSLAELRAAAAVAAANLRIARLELAAARREAELDVVRAPLAGVVSRVHVALGARVGAEPLVELVPDGRRVVRAHLAEEYSGQVAVGQAFEIAADDGNGARLHGRIEALSPVLTDGDDADGNERGFDCVLSFDGTSLEVGRHVLVFALDAASRVPR